MQIVAGYRVVFDAAEAGYRHWESPALGLLLTLVGVAILVYDRLLPDPRHSTFRRIFACFYTAFAAIWTVLAFATTYFDYVRLREALAAGRYEVVEGVVTDFEPMPYEGHAEESFRIGGHRYSYSDFVLSAGFNNTATHGGPIRDGLRVRIADVDGEIGRLEVME